MSTVLILAVRCGAEYAAGTCARPAGHRPAKAHRLEPTAGDLRRTLRPAHEAPR